LQHCSLKKNSYSLRAAMDDSCQNVRMCIRYGKCVHIKKVKDVKAANIGENYP